jgi:Peptidase family M28
MRSRPSRDAAPTGAPHGEPRILDGDDAERAGSSERQERHLSSDGVAHLRALAARPRFAGSAEEASARAYCARVLRDAGWDVSVAPFEYSTLPGRFGTPIGGAIATATVAVTSVLAGVLHAPRAASIVFVAGLLALGVFTRRMLGDGVLDLPWMRARGENLVARRGAASPRVWLVAHLDTKSQPIPSKTRMLGVLLLVAALGLTMLALALTLVADWPRTTPWLLCIVLGVVGGGIVVASVVGNESPGAVDNGSGVAAVLSAAARLDESVAVGVLLPSAEELGLAGARAWVRACGAERAFVLNCDGVDDQGELTIMYTRGLPVPIVDAVRDSAAGDVRVRRMPPGLLLDSVAFADAGWSAVTVSHGSMRTLGRVHTPADSLDRLEGRAIESVAALLAGTAEALAR